MLSPYHPSCQVCYHGGIQVIIVGTCIIQAPSGKTPYLLHVYSYLLKAELPIYIVLYCSH